ncbi:hypothetical protein APA_429 [Pseudanabaena sp. lw0831]|nr:hypothetical protein APA_429 [Pseudanabaena sp. lw0831]
MGIIAQINRKISEQVCLADGREATPSLLSRLSRAMQNLKNYPNPIN